MAEDTRTDEEQESRLATTYEALRRREYELISDLLELLPKIDTLGEDRVAQVRDALFHADHPFLMVFVGPFSSGKSSLINALCGEEVLAVGPVPTTDRISILRYGDEKQQMDSAGEVQTVFYPSKLLQKVSFVDTPGLESVFRDHEEITRKFLHRSDVVMLVMLATQAMTQRNLDYMQQLRDYGKKIILVVNQVDLLSDEDIEKVRQYVTEQSQDRLKIKPEVWMVSARKGLAARDNGALDTEKWAESGLKHFEDYIDEQLDDVQRLRQKLQTPLQIVQNVHKVALEAVRANQAVLDQYQGIADNVEAQLAAYRREQEKTVRELNEAVSKKFEEAADRGATAIRDTFKLSRTLGTVRIGLVDVLGLGSLFRRGKPAYARQAFERFKVYEPIDELPDTSGKLGPRLEGKDLQDIDDLVSYARREIDKLPPTIQGKVIGEVRAPLKYDRSALQSIRPELEAIENEARVEETDKLESSVRSVRFGLALFELLIVAGLVIMALTNFNLGVFLILVFLGVLGLLAMPVVGYFMALSHKNRLLKLQGRYIDVMTRASDRQVEYGMTLRREVVGPLTRLVETQTQISTEQMNKLASIEQEMVKVESELARLGKRRLLGG
ncbi:MAG: dynamin family protein [Chloroflexota bacterium]